MSGNVPPIEKLVSFALHDAEVAKTVSQYDDYNFGTSKKTNQLLLIRDFLKHYNGSDIRPDLSAFRTYLETIKLAPIERSAAQQVYSELSIKYKPKELPCLGVFLNEHQESIAIERAKANMKLNPYAAIRELRALGYDEKKIAQLRRGLAQKTQRVSAKSLMELENIVEEEPLIDGVLRRGEILNLVAAPKARKSWLVHSLAIALEHGGEWLGIPTRPSRVLIIDNELRLATIKRRLRTIYDAQGVEPTDNLSIESARGRKLTIDNLPELVKDGQFDVIILDALYRFFPANFVENDNGAMTQLYNELDEVATETGAAIIVVHHTSKGSQAIKSVTDVGSGASAQSRAADVHMVLRPFSQTGDTAKETRATLDVVCRSFAPKERIVLDWEYPQWQVTNAMDAPIAAMTKDQVTAKMFVDRFATDSWEGRSVIEERAVDKGMSNAAAKAKFKDAVEQKLLTVKKVVDGKARSFFYKKADNEQPF